MRLQKNVAIKQEEKTILQRLVWYLRNNMVAWLIILPFLILMVYVLWLPTIQGIIWSFYKMKGYNPDGFIGLENFKVVFKDTEFVAALGNMGKYIIWSLILGYWEPILLAILLNEIKIGKNFFKFTMYFPAIIPMVAVAMLFYYMYYPNESGLLNAILASCGIGVNPWLQNENITIQLILIMNGWKSMGATMLLYLAALQSVDKSHYEAAMMDGAGFARRVWHISMPQMSSIMLLNFVRQIIAVFQTMEAPLAMTGGGPNNASLSLGLLGYRYAFQNFKIGSALALNVTMFVVLIILTSFYFVVKGKTEQD